MNDSNYHLERIAAGDRARDAYRWEEAIRAYSDALAAGELAPQTEWELRASRAYCLERIARYRAAIEDLERLGEIGRLHLKVYDSYHVDALNLSRPDVMVAWAVRNGIDRKRWLDAYDSPEVDARIERAKALTAAYAVRGTPSLVVDGRYLATWDLAHGDPPRMVAVLEDLVRLARRDRAGR